MAINLDSIRSRFYLLSGHKPQLYIQEWGPPAGPACILLHGLADGSYVWRDLIEALMPVCRVVAIDLRGHGDSERSADGVYSLDSYVGDIEAALSRLALDDYVLIGHSLGGDIIAKLARRSLRGLLGAVLVDAGPSPKVHYRQELRNLVLEAQREYNSASEYAAYLQETRMLATFDMIEWIANQSLRRTCDKYQLKFDPRVLDILTDDPADDWWWDALPHFNQPVLLVRGIASAMLTPDLVRKMQQRIPKSQAVVVKRAGHAVMTDNPSGFAELVKLFVFSLVEPTG